MKLRLPDRVSISSKETDVQLNYMLDETTQPKCLHVTITAETTPLKWITFTWQADCIQTQDVKLLGDTWERSYGNLGWRTPENSTWMPWYFFAAKTADAGGDSLSFVEAFGVKVRPNSLCAWRYTGEQITLSMDIRSGGEGVLLGGRTLHVADIIFEEYQESSALECARDFCKKMCGDPLLPETPVFGSNNWYYAEGDISQDSVLEDTKLIAKLSRDCREKPYMVIDDGWQLHPCDGPWDRCNQRFSDMSALTQEMKAMGVRPGIWIRYLADRTRSAEDVAPDMRLARNPEYLDPSHPAVLERIRKDTRRIVGWGFTLIKHDFSTFDLFGDWGVNRGQFLTDDGWHFYDRARTSAEIVLGFYRTILDAAEGKALILGCNTISHLCAGLVHLNRIGDDTSGKDWERTVKMGFNTLIYRLPQHNTFYAVDADCIGVTGKIPWELNRTWLERLAVSGTPLFLSCRPGIASEKELAQMEKALQENERKQAEYDRIWQTALLEEDMIQWQF